MSALDKLNPRQQMFCREYIIDFNGTRAAIAAGYSEKTARTTAAKLNAKGNIQKAIQELIQKRTEKVEIDAEWVLRRLHAEATADVAELFDANGKLKKVKDWPLIFRQGLVAGFDVETVIKTGDDKATLVSKVKLASRERKVELIGKHVDVQAFRDRLQVEEGNDIAAMKAAQARAEAAKEDEEEDDWEKQNDIEQAEEQEDESSTFADDLEAAQAMALAADNNEEEGEAMQEVEHDFDPNE
ncbi:MAG: terminase small subunit [Candidatus Thiodiazotropha endolucinida]